MTVHELLARLAVVPNLDAEVVIAEFEPERFTVLEELTLGVVSNGHFESLEDSKERQKHNAICLWPG